MPAQSSSGHRCPGDSTAKATINTGCGISVTSYCGTVWGSDSGLVVVVRSVCGSISSCSISSSSDSSSRVVVVVEAVVLVVAVVVVVVIVVVE